MATVLDGAAEIDRHNLLRALAVGGIVAMLTLLIGMFTVTVPLDEQHDPVPSADPVAA